MLGWQYRGVGNAHQAQADLMFDQLSPLGKMRIRLKVCGFHHSHYE
jgi:hypothetical protein